MRGKKKCRILKEIRQRIADENEIPYVTRECTYQGECSGTCPKCEAELRYLEEQLESRKRMGKCVTVAALTASFMLSSTGCLTPTKDVPAEMVTPSNNVPADTTPARDASTEMTEDIFYNEMAGSLPYTEVVKGEVAPSLTEMDGLFELEGDVAAPEQETENLTGMISLEPDNSQASSQQ